MESYAVAKVKTFPAPRPLMNSVPFGSTVAALAMFNALIRMNGIFGWAEDQAADAGRFSSTVPPAALMLCGTISDVVMVYPLTVRDVPGPIIPSRLVSLISGMPATITWPSTPVTTVTFAPACINDFPPGSLVSEPVNPLLKNAEPETVISPPNTDVPLTAVFFEPIDPETKNATSEYPDSFGEVGPPDPDRINT